MHKLFAYRPALDGLRGYGMLLFMLGHLGVLTFLPGLWVYMNGFFVLSAFLITRLLLAEKRLYGDISAAEFYVRRARRLLPALFVTLTAVILDGLFFAPATERAYLKGDVLSTLFYVMNWRLVARDDAYFEEFSHPSILRHAWSLSVEEQFYVLVPFLIMGVLLYLNSRLSRTLVFAGIAVASAIWTATIDLGSLAGQAHAYYGTDVRVQALAVGAALGVASGHLGRGRKLCKPLEADEPLDRDPSRATALGWLGLAGMVVLFVVASPFSGWMFNRGGMLLSCVLCAAYIVGCLQSERSLLVRLHEWRPIVYTGKISYGLYLYHWPIFMWLRRAFGAAPTWVLALVTVAVTYAVASASYRYLERPVMRHVLRAFGQPFVRGRAIAGAWTAAVVAGALAMSTGAVAEDKRGGVPQYVPEIPTLVAGQARWSDPKRPVKVALFGDSVPYYLSHRLPQDNFPGLAVTNLGVPGCDLLDQTVVWTQTQRLANDSQCAASKRDLAAHVRQAGVSTLVIMPGLELGIPHEWGTKTIWLDNPAYAGVIEKQLDLMVSRARVGGVSKVAVTTVPCRSVNDLDIPEDNKAQFKRNPKVTAEVERPDGVNRIITDWAKRKNVPVFDLAAPICQQPYRAQLHGKRLYDDGIHFSPDASPMVWAWLAPQIQKLTS